LNNNIREKQLIKKNKKGWTANYGLREDEKKKRLNNNNNNNKRQLDDEDNLEGEIFLKKGMIRLLLVFIYFF